MSIQPAHKGISVIICCYNSEKRIRPTLQHLKAQQFHSEINWEVIIVDNLCTDETVASALNEWNNFKIPLRIIREEEPGLSKARKKGIMNAQFEYLIFCDDDNHFYSEYLQQTWDIFEIRPNVKMIGGQGIPLPEGNAPVWLTQYASSYAAAPQKSTSGWTNGVYGAGMAIRQSCFMILLEAGFISYLTDRKGNSLSSGEDSEWCYAFRMAGWNIWYEENMKFSHAIPENRLTWDYLIRLHKGFSASYVVLKVYESILTPEVSFSPFKELLYYLALLIKYYPKFKNAQEGNKLILHYHGWKIIAHHLWKYLIERNEKKKNIEKLYAELKKMNT
jgi:glycosyltransferase involved in cell wall biosynthesis